MNGHTLFFAEEDQGIDGQGAAGWIHAAMRPRKSMVTVTPTSTRDLWRGLVDDEREHAVASTPSRRPAAEPMASRRKARPASAQDLALRCAQSDANAELAQTLADYVRSHAENSGDARSAPSNPRTPRATVATRAANRAESISSFHVLTVKGRLESRPRMAVSSAAAISCGLRRERTARFVWLVGY